MSILNESLASRISGWDASTEPAAEMLAPVGGVSYLRGANFPPLAYITIPQLLREAVARFGPREALVFCEQDIRLSYYDFDRAVDELASGLLILASLLCCCDPGCRLFLCQFIDGVNCCDVGFCA